jgi:hypothetical protein
MATAAEKMTAPSRQFEFALRNNSAFGQFLLPLEQAQSVVELRLERGDIGAGARHARA